MYIYGTRKRWEENVCALIDFSFDLVSHSSAESLKAKMHPNLRTLVCYSENRGNFRFNGCEWKLIFIVYTCAILISTNEYIFNLFQSSLNVRRKENKNHQGIQIFPRHYHIRTYSKYSK